MTGVIKEISHWADYGCTGYDLLMGDKVFVMYRESGSANTKECCSSAE